MIISLLVLRFKLNVTVQAPNLQVSIGCLFQIKIPSEDKGMWLHALKDLSETSKEVQQDIPDGQ